MSNLSFGPPMVYLLLNTGAWDWGLLIGRLPLGNPSRELVLCEDSHQRRQKMRTRMHVLNKVSQKCVPETSRDDSIRKNMVLLAMHARSHQRSADSISPKMVHDEVPPTSGQKSSNFDINLFFRGPLLERPSFCQI